jgi:hypothetical protein
VQKGDISDKEKAPELVLFSDCEVGINTVVQVSRLPGEHHNSTSPSG